MRAIHVRSNAALALLLIVLTPHVASAAWPLSGAAVCTDLSTQLDPEIATDGAGGAFITWVDLRNPIPTSFIQHVLASGSVDPAWPVNGLALPEGNFPQIISDGAGGAIVTWAYNRPFTVTGSDILAHHVLATGVLDPVWPAGGAVLCSAFQDQVGPVIVSDGAGGAFVAWQDLRSLVYDIYAQHVLASGAVDAAWPANGLAVCTAGDVQIYPTMVPDGAGGMIVTWDDHRSLTNYRVYAQRVLPAGLTAAGWPANGLALCTAAGDQMNPTIAPDGAHGAFVTWHDGRTGTGYHIYAQHALATGGPDPAWPVSGLAVCTAAVDQLFPTIVSDGGGGALVTWQDMRNNTNYDIFAQHVLVAGAVDAAWPVNGTQLSTATSTQTHPVIAPDGSAGAFVAWQDYWGEYNIYAQHVLSSGALDAAWPAAGRGVCTLANDQELPTITAAGQNGAIVTWLDFRSDPLQSDIYAMSLLADASAGVGPPVQPHEIALEAPSPNPAPGAVRLRFALPIEEPVRLAIYDLGGRRVRQLIEGVEGPGAHAISWDVRDDAGHALGAGLYFERLEAGAQVLSRRFATLR